MVTHSSDIQFDNCYRVIGSLSALVSSLGKERANQQLNPNGSYGIGYFLIAVRYVG